MVTGSRIILLHPVCRMGEQELNKLFNNYQALTLASLLKENRLVMPLYPFIIQVVLQSGLGQYFISSLVYRRLLLCVLPFKDSHSMKNSFC